MRISPVNLTHNNYKNQKPQQKTQQIKRESSRNLSNIRFTGYKPEYSEHVVKFWNYIKNKNGQMFRMAENGIWKPCVNEEIINNVKNGFNFLENLDYFKRAFSEHFCKETGFPNLAKVSENIDNEILKNARNFETQINSKLLFAAYDTNNSAGKRMALPGSDCDGLLFIYNDGAYDSSFARWGVLNDVNRRIVNPHLDFPPELFKVSEMDNGLKILNKAFYQLEKELTAEDYKTFSNNLQYKGKNFLKSADFNIRLTKFIPDEEKNLAAMTGYLIEYIRAGKILENKLPPEFIKQIQQSPAYKYSNILRQEAFEPLIKEKIKAREGIEHEFARMQPEEKYRFVKNLVFSSFDLPVEPQYKKYFKVDGDGKNLNTEMGNIIEMYQKLF